MDYELYLDGKIETHCLQGVSSIMPVILQNMLKSTTKLIKVYYDPDIDGVVAGELATRFVENILGRPSSYIINSNRSHGFKADYDDFDGDNIIGVDFDITSETMCELTKRGNNVIILDHHECEDAVILYDNGVKLDFKEYACSKEKLKSLKGKQGLGILINNQYPTEPDSSRYLSGAGVVFESILSFLKLCIPKKVDNWDTREQRAMVGWTLLSDMRDLRSLNAKLYLQELYTYNKHPQANTRPGYDLIEQLRDTLNEIEVQNEGFAVPRIGEIQVDRAAIDFKLSPLMNATFRFNEGDKVVEYMRGDITAVPIEMHMRQKLLTKLMRENAIIQDFEADNFMVLTIDTSSSAFDYQPNMKDEYLKDPRQYLTNFVGLLCNHYKDNRSVIGYCIDGSSKMQRASFRGRCKVDYRRRLNEAGLLNGAGHGAAFGIIDMDTSPKNLEKIAKLCSELDEHAVIETDTIEEVKSFSTYCKRKKKTKIPGYCKKVYDKADVSKAYAHAYLNMFENDGDRIRIRCKYNNQNNINVFWNKNNTWGQFTVEDIQITCYDYNLKLTNGLILPILENGSIKFYLDLADPESKIESAVPFITNDVEDSNLYCEDDDLDYYESFD